MTTCDDLDDAQSTLPLHPWTTLRPATGMLLGSEDFEVLMGNPRAKHMVHNAWLHGRGVVWGLGLRKRGDWDLEVSPGLAVDGHGRELHLDAPRRVSLRDLLEKQHDPTCGKREVTICLVLHFDSCLDAPVPALVEPCDVTRESTTMSRVVERVRLEAVLGCPAERTGDYHRVRVLLGLDEVGGGGPAKEGGPDKAGERALALRREVAAAPASARARLLLRHFRCLAAEDAADRRPDADECEGELFPVPGTDAGVVLGCLRLVVKDESGCPEIVGEPELDLCCRPVVVPTTVLQDLVCALAPGLVGDSATAGGGPQVMPEVDWDRDSEGRHVLRLRATDDLVPGSVRRAVRISSLSDTEWVAEDLMGPPRYDAEHRTIVVTFADRPANPILRIVVRGTGATPVYGASPPVPLAGIHGDDPGATHQGRDAVITVPNPLLERKGS